MKISFQKEDITQPPVTPAQVAMRQSPIRKRPVLRTILILLLMAVAAYGVYRLAQSRKLYTYGLVAAPVQTLHIPERATVKEVLVHQGERVKKGQRLFSLATKSALDRQMARSTATVADTGRWIKQREAELQLQRQQAAFERAELERKSAVEKAHIEVAKLTEFYTAKCQRHQNLKSLLEADAAVSAQVEAARVARELAANNLAQAWVDLDLAEKRPNPYTAALELARLRYDALRSETPVTAPSAPASAQALDFRASLDGVVTAVNVTPGDAVFPGKAAMTVADLSTAWVQAYLPPEKASRVHAGQAVTLYGPGQTQGTPATLTTRGIVVPTPEALLPKMPDTPNSLFLRIDFDNQKTKAFLAGSLVKVVITP